MLAALQMPDVDDNDELHDLTLRIGYAGPDKRLYEGMQSRYNGAGRPRMLSDPADVADRNESAVERSMDNPTVVDGVRDMTDESPDSDPAINTLSEVTQEPVNKTASIAPPTNSSLFDKPPSNSPIAETTIGTTAISAEDYSNNMTALYTTRGDAPISDPITDCIETTTGSLPPNKQNTDRIANSTVPGTCTVLTHTDPAVFARIITSIGINCVESNFAILASILEIEK
ncbi:hypothetical protein BGZ57DRAFT_1003268 [Hyaloscypha finlandica]|nr:hypothetical protein BGZ57DRAFT_1003268 [Hyaloscypha finlandica]